MTELLRLIFTHSNEQVRRLSCSVLTATMLNNRQVQEFASKSGAINLVDQFEREETLPAKISVFNCLATWLKADNFEAKRRFISDRQGLDFLTQMATDAAMKATLGDRLRANMYRLINDLVVNDDGIFEEQPDHVRRHFASHQDFLNQLAAELTNQDLRSHRMQLREVILQTVFRLH